MNTKTYLQQYRNLTNKVRRYHERVEQIQDTLKAVNLDGLPKGGNISDPTAKAALSLAILREELTAAEVEAEIMAQTIADQIEAVPCEKSRELLFCRYILLMKWEDVARALDRFRPYQNYEVKHVVGYMHKKALDEFGEVLKKWPT